MSLEPSVLAKNILDSAQLEAGRLLFAAECQFVTAAATLDGLPAESLPEVAFLGRSNVGKSSLINALTGRATLARTSNTPGRTRQLNFFALGRRLLLVDMPGYGYANAAKTEIERWHAVIDAYLRGRAGLRRLCLLIDARHGLKPNDVAVMDWLDRRAVIYQIALTKLDKLKANERQDSVAAIERQIVRRPAAFPAVAATSSESGLGIPELRAMLCELALPRQ